MTKEALYVISMSDPIDDLPAEIRALVRRIHERQVAGGSERHKKSGDRSGLEGQKEVSKILQDAGVYKNDPRWTATRDHGRALYYGTSTTIRATRTAQMTQSPLDEGPISTKGTTFRARAEAVARAFRVRELRAAHGKLGHLLDERAIEAGSNFLHPAALVAAQARAAKGKGVDRERTFGNMLSSQAMCFNLLGPLAGDAEGLELAGAALSHFVPKLARVQSIEIEYTPAFETFRDQSGRAGVDCDALFEFDDTNGQPCVLVLETKFVETSFSSCGHRSKDNDPCPQDVTVGKDFSGCRYVSKNRFEYWQRSAETNSIHLPVVDGDGCPFGGPLWQIWVNHTLAHAEASNRGGRSAVFAVCAPEGNEALQARAQVERFRPLATNPQTIVFIPLEMLLDRLVEACAGRDAWSDWARLLRLRYSVPDQVPARVQEAQKNTTHAATTAGHRRVISWMTTPAFRELVSAHQDALGDRASIYFRPTDRGLVRIALHPLAPAYVGFHAQAGDDAHVIAAQGAMPTIDELRSHMHAFEAWLPSVKRSSDEERGVIPWLRRALINQLWLPDLGPDWVFLHQEWRFVDRLGVGKKSDILAVHVPTGQLGIVEFKSSASVLGEARKQVDEYAEFWDRSAAELAPVFTELLRALGLAYGNEPAANVTVSTEPAARFVGIASPTKPVRIFRHATDD